MHMSKIMILPAVLLSIITIIELQWDDNDVEGAIEYKYLADNKIDVDQIDINAVDDIIEITGSGNTLMAK